MKGLAARVRDRSGQAMTEYVLVTLVAVTGLIGFSLLLRLALRSYLEPIYFFVGLPIP